MKKLLLIFLGLSLPLFLWTGCGGSEEATSAEAVAAEVEETEGAKHLEAEADRMAREAKAKAEEMARNAKAEAVAEAEKAADALNQ